MKKLLLVILLAFAAVSVFYACAPKTQKYEVEKIEKPDDALYGVESVFLNCKIELSENTLTVKNGDTVRLVLHFGEEGDTGSNEYTYSYTSDGRLLLVYKGDTYIYLIKVD